MDLRLLQTRFQNAVIQGGVVESILDQPPMSPDERMEVYRFAYLERLAEAIGADFPCVRQVIGDERRFRDLVREYLAQHPSSHFSISFVGESLPVFLMGHVLTQEFPHLPELARLEWWIIRARFASDPDTVSVERLLRLDDQEREKVLLRLSAPTRILDVAWNSEEIWSAGSLQRPVPLVKQPGIVAVHRLGGFIGVTRLSASDSALLKQAESGVHLGKLIHHSELLTCAPFWIERGVLEVHLA